MAYRTDPDRCLEHCHCGARCAELSTTPHLCICVVHRYLNIQNHKPLVLVGETRSHKNVKQLEQLGWGRLFLHRHPTPYNYERWGFDNGAFMAWRNHKPFPEQEFTERLKVALATPATPYLAVTPDIVANGCESLQFSLQWRTKLPRDWPWYLAVQDGMTIEDVEPHLHLFAGLFLGGTDDFKCTAEQWCALAHKHQLKFHYGRCGTPAKLLHACDVKADSLDSAFPLWSDERMQGFVTHWQSWRSCYV